MIKNSLLAVLLFLGFSSCKGQPQPEFIGEKAYNLSHIDSTMDVRKFYSKVMVNGENWEEFKDSKERYRHSFRRDILYGTNERGDEKDTAVKYIIYSHVNASTDDKLAYWEDTYFNKLCMIANKSNQLMAIAAVAKETSDKVYQDLLKELDEKFGKHTTLHKDFFGDVKINQWQTDALEIQLVPGNNNGSNTMKIVVDSNGASQQKAAPEFDCYLYIFVKKYKELAHDRIREGDFTLCY